MSINCLSQPRAPFWKSPVLGGALFGVISACWFGYEHGFLPPHGLTDLSIVLLVGLVRGSIFGSVVAWWFAPSKTVARETASDSRDA